MLLSISNLLSRLTSSAPPRPLLPLAYENEDSKRVGTTIRLEPNVRHFVEHQAQHLGISVQDFISLTLRSVMIASETPELSELDLMVSRFFELFSAHDIGTADIPSLLPSGTLARSDLQRRDRVIDALDDHVIDHLAALFLIEPDWLRGRAVNVTPGRDRSWYKNVHAFGLRLCSLKLDPTVTHLEVAFVVRSGVTMEHLSLAYRKGDDYNEIKVTPMICVTRTVAGRSFVVYEPWETQRWNYEPCRIDLKLAMLICQNARIYFHAIRLEKEVYQALTWRQALPAPLFSGVRNVWLIDELLWSDERNPEREELAQVRREYANRKLNKYAEALERPYRITNLEEVLRGITGPELTPE